MLRFWHLDGLATSNIVILQKPITLKNVFVSDIGIKVYLKKIKFGDQRDDNIDYHLH